MKYKITDVYEVEAETKEEAIMKLDNRNRDKDYYKDVKRVIHQKVEVVNETKHNRRTA